MNKKNKLILVLISVLVFVISLFNECFKANGTECYGFMALILGWMNVSMSFVCWFANPLYLLAIIMLYVHRVAAVVISIMAFGLAISFHFINQVLVNEAGTITKIDSLSIGYWLWLLSIGIIIFASILNLKVAADARSESAGL